ncbi:MAG: STAS domain-containing protein [Leptospiraceae bacterium]|nr:STAS domain-containing protein [Leptospiraceae bacterium]MCP5498988.1 STAS domain-containing protein [Leptospiraceae bacterium]
MKLTTKNNIHVFRLEGSILQDEGEKLDLYFSELLGHAENQIVVDMTEANHICSMVLGQLVFYKKKVNALGGDIKLIITDEDLLELFDITLLNRVFEIYSNMDEAQSSFENQ